MNKYLNLKIGGSSNNTDSLLIACKEGNIDNVKRLLNSGHINFNKRDETGLNCIEIAFRSNNLVLIKLLLDQHIEFDKQQFISAMLLNNIDLVKLLLNYIDNINIVINGIIPLEFALKNLLDIKITELLILNGARIDEDTLVEIMTDFKYNMGIHNDDYFFQVYNLLIKYNYFNDENSLLEHLIYMDGHYLKNILLFYIFYNYHNEESISIQIREQINFNLMFRTKEEVEKINMLFDIKKDQLKTNSRLSTIRYLSHVARSVEGKSIDNSGIPRNSNTTSLFFELDSNNKLNKLIGNSKMLGNNGYLGRNIISFLDIQKLNFPMELLYSYE